MTIIGSDGPSILLRAIVQQRVGPEFENHLDELLVWLNKGGPEGELTARLKLHGVAQTVALQRSLQLIDQHLFSASRAPHEVLGLPADASAKTVRLRYRRLIQAFHPDRQPDRQQWLTERTEQLNRAYHTLKNKTAPPVNPEPTSGPSSRAAPQRVRPAKPRMTPVNVELSSGITLALRLRSMLGAGRSFEKRFFTALFVLCFGFLGYLYYLNKPPAERLQVSTEPFATVVKETEQQTQVARVSPSPMSLSAASRTDASYLTAGTVRAIEAELDSGSPQPEFYDLGPVAVSGAADSRARDLEPEPVSTAASQPDELASTLATVTALLPEEPVPYQDIVKPSRPDMSHTAQPEITPKRHLAAQVLQNEWPEAQQQPAGQMSQSKPVSMPKVAREKPAPDNSRVSSVASDPKSPTSRLQPDGLAACSNFQVFLAQYTMYYDRGDTLAYADLFSPLATENRLQGRAHIQQVYQDWFSQTRQRRLQLQDLSGRAISPQRCLIEGQYTVSYREPNGDRSVQSGWIEFLLERAGRSYHIISLRY